MHQDLNPVVSDLVERLTAINFGNFGMWGGFVTKSIYDVQKLTKEEKELFVSLYLSAERKRLETFMKINETTPNLPIDPLHICSKLNEAKIYPIEMFGGLLLHTEEGDKSPLNQDDIKAIVGQLPRRLYKAEIKNAFPAVCLQFEGTCVVHYEVNTAALDLTGKWSLDNNENYNSQE